MCDSAKKAEQIKALKNGKGVKYLLSEAYKIFANPILIHDMEYKVIDLNENIVTDDPIWNEYASAGTVGFSWLDFFKNECFFDTAANAKKITFLTSDKLKYNRIFGKLFNKNNIQIGCACMVECNKPFDEDVAVLFDDICTVFSREFGRIKLYTHYGQAYLEKLIGELIAGITDKELYTAHVESIYMHLKANLYLAVADVGGCRPSYDQLANIRELLRKARPDFTYAIYNNYILFIASTDEPTLSVEKDLARLGRVFRKNNIYSGISRSFDNLFELQKYYGEALSALSRCTEHSGRHIAFYEHTEDSSDE